MTGAMIVEDNFLIAMEMEAELGDRGIVPVSAFCAVKDALESLDFRPPRFALLDINLRGETSEPVARALRERGIPFVFVSGNEATLLPEDLRDVPLFGKPVDWGMLARWIADV